MWVPPGPRRGCRPPRVEDRDDGRMVQPGGRLGLAPEAHEEVGVAGEVGSQHLDRDLSPEPGVVAQVDVGHAAAPDELTDLVASPQDAGCGRHGFCLSFVPCFVICCCPSPCRALAGRVRVSVGSPSSLAPAPTPRDRLRLGVSAHRARRGGGGGRVVVVAARRGLVGVPTSGVVSLGWGWLPSAPRCPGASRARRRPR